MAIKEDENGFDYEAFRQETIAKMLAGETELTGKLEITFTELGGYPPAVDDSI